MQSLQDYFTEEKTVFKAMHTIGSKIPEEDEIPKGLQLVFTSDYSFN